MKLTKEQLLEKIRAAYAKTGLEQYFGDYTDGSESSPNCVCPVMIIHCCIYKNDFSPSSAKNTFAKLFDVDRDWVNNFIHGVDGTGNYGGRNLEEGFQYGQFIRYNLLTETRSTANMVDSSSANEKLSG